MADLSLMVFHMDKVSMKLHPRFIPKVMLDIYISQNTYLPVFYRKPYLNREDVSSHVLDVHRALAFFLQRGVLF